MTSPLISVITPIYNCSSYLKESFESIFNQTFKDFEFIVINDGSTDDTSEVAQKLLEGFSGDFKFIDHHTNKCIPTRRNEAIEASRGKYIAIHDGDDVSFPYRFEKEAEILEKEGIFCVGGRAIKINENSEEIGTMDYPSETNIQITRDFVYRCTNPIIDPTTMFRKDIFNKYGGYTLEKMIYTVPDMDLWLKAILDGHKFYNIQESIIKYRVNSKGMTREHKQEMINAHMIVWRRFIIEWRKKNA